MILGNKVRKFWKTYGVLLNYHIHHNYALLLDILLIFFMKEKVP